ncbi:MAG: hypothetical protein ACE141_03525 [Bryobacteraceae bacterium]
MRLAILGVLAAVSATLPLAAQCWDKPVEKWTEADARRVLADSPWARASVPSLQEAVIMPALTAGDLPFPLSKLTIRWESAKPIVHARRMSGSTPLAQDDGCHYQVSIAGFRIDRQRAESVLGEAEATLQYCSHDPVKAASVRVVRDLDDTPLVVFQFPKTEAVREPGVFRILPFGARIRSNEFHFTARVGPVTMKQKFDLRDMIFLRELAL